MSSSWLFVFLCCFFFHYVSATFHLWPSSGDLPRPRIGMLSLVTVSPLITAFHSCWLSHHVFDQVNLWPAWVGFETAIFWQCSPGTVETQRLYPPLSFGARGAANMAIHGKTIKIPVTWGSLHLCLFKMTHKIPWIVNLLTFQRNKDRTKFCFPSPK